MEYSFNCLKELFGNYGYDFQYEVIPKRNECWATRTHLDYLNIIVDIRDKYGNHIFFTDENVFTLKTGEKMICEKVMNICVGNYDIFGEDVNFHYSHTTAAKRSHSSQYSVPETTVPTTWLGLVRSLEQNVASLEPLPPRQQNMGVTELENGLETQLKIM